MNDLSSSQTESFIPLREVCKFMGLKPNTVRSWAQKGKILFVKTPSGQIVYPKSQFQTLISSISTQEQNEEKENILYCRVSSKKQMDDLERQKQFLQSLYPQYKLVTDCASGINWKRKGLQSILESAMQRRIGDVVVAHKDRLCRFGFELIKFIIESNKGRVIVLDEETNKSTEQELAEDLLSIIHIYSCRQMGKRRYIKKQKNSTQSESETEEITS